MFLTINCINFINKLIFSPIFQLMQNLLSLHYFPEILRQNLLTALKSRKKSFFFFLCVFVCVFDCICLDVYIALESYSTIIYRVGLAQSVACTPLGRVIPMTIIKMVQTASLHGTQCVMGLSHERIFRRMIRRMSSFSNTSRWLYTSFVYAPNTLAYALTTSHTAKPQEEF